MYNYWGFTTDSNVICCVPDPHPLHSILLERGTKLLRENFQPSHGGCTPSPFSSLGGEG